LFAVATRRLEIAASSIECRKEFVAIGAGI